MYETVIKQFWQEKSVAYVVTDRELQVLQCGGALQLLINRESRLHGCSIYNVAPELISLEDVLADLLAGVVERHELTFVNRSTAANETLYVSIVNLPFRDENGAISGLLHLVEDITEVGKTEQEIIQKRNELSLMQKDLAKQNTEFQIANSELQRLDEVKSKFISIAAHELRSPLTAIVGYLELLRDRDDRPFSEMQQECLSTIERSTHRLLNITSNLLDITSIETGQFELALRPVILTSIALDVVNELQLFFKDKEQKLSVHIQPNLPAVLCDETRTAQILSNLLTNAHKYTPKGGAIQVQIQRSMLGEFVEVSVHDNGIGIPIEEQGRVFDRFFRAQSAQLSGADGAGLGLGIARLLVEQHGGEIWFESETGHGTTFFVTLPIDDGLLSRNGASRQNA